jgi:hypothetical protein
VTSLYQELMETARELVDPASHKCACPPEHRAKAHSQAEQTISLKREKFVALSDEILPQGRQDMRVALITTGNPDQARSLGRSMVTIQQSLVAQNQRYDGQVSMCVISFLDGRIRRTGYSAEPRTLGQDLSNWECHITNTSFAATFSDLARGAKDQRPDVVIVLGNRFNDEFGETQKAAQRLHKLGTRVFTIFLGNPNRQDQGTDQVAAAYRAIADASGGCSLELNNINNPQQVSEFLAPIVAHVGGDTRTLRKLTSNPKNKQLQSWGQKLLPHSKPS